MTKKLPSLLIIEDDQELSSTLSTRFADEGYQVITTAKINDSLGKIDNQQFACILLDLYLDGDDGEEVVDYIREQKKGPNFKTPIVVISGNLRPDTIKRIRARVNHFAVKPFDFDDLVQKVKSFS